MHLSRRQLAGVWSLQQPGRHANDELGLRRRCCGNPAESPHEAWEVVILVPVELDVPA